MALYAKVDCMLDSNPKIRKAGRCGREVFLFLLRRNRMLDARGILTPGNIDPDYLAEQLMMTREEAVTGVTACCNASLLSVTAENVAIIGWSDEWAREPKSNAERQADHRRKAKEIKLLELGNQRAVTERNGSNVTRNANNARKEKKREEQNREEEYAADAAPRASREAACSGFDPSNPHEPPPSRKDANPAPQPPFVASSAPGQPKQKKRLTAQSSAVSQHVDKSVDYSDAVRYWFDLFAQSNGGAKATWGSAQGQNLQRLIKAHGPEEVRRRMENAHRAPPWPHEPPRDFLAFAGKFDHYASPAMRRAGGTAPPVPIGRSIADAIFADALADEAREREGLQ